MRNPILLFGGLFFLFLLNACHRPYALVQRTPSPRFKSPDKAIVSQPVLQQSDSARITSASSTLNDSVSVAEMPDEVAFASIAPVVEPATRTVARRVARMQSLLETSAKVEAQQPRPRPKSRNNLRLGNRIRESLGLPLREELNWWQRIDWKLKGSIFVIGIAIVFALLGLGQLALIFGLIGALLLVLGLKRSFKSRRPWL